MLLRLNPRFRALSAICLVLTSAIALLFWKQWFFGSIEQRSRDWLLTNSDGNRSPQDPRIVFLALDENSRDLSDLFADEREALARESPVLYLMSQGFPWHRKVWAHVIDRLADAGAKVIILDLVFPTEKEGDDAFRAALDRHSDRVVLGAHLASDDRDENGVGLTSRPRQYILPAPNLCPPPGAPSWIGFVNVYSDEDFLVRRIYYRTTFQELTGIPASSESKELLSLSARGLEKAGFSDRIPTGRTPVMFRFADTFRPFSLHDIFNEKLWKGPPYNGGQLFKDKIVLIGSSGQASEDRLQTPYGVSNGPQIHLSAINAALNHDFLHETTFPTNVGLIAGGGLLAWMLGAWIALPVLRLFVLALLALGYQQVCQHLVNDFGIVPILSSPLLALTACGITWAAWEQVADRLERQRTRRALERYVGQDVAGEVLDNPTSYLDTLGGKRKDVTILFSDIRGFTTLTESADAHQLVTQLNEYFTEMVAIVFAQQGTLDKFIGDAVMAHWGGIASAGPETDAVRAVTTALEMFEALKKLNADWKTRGITEWAIGIGLNHGAPITGNIGASGARERFDFTVVGDAVNLASRLEGTTKNYLTSNSASGKLWPPSCATSFRCDQSTSLR